MRQLRLLYRAWRLAEAMWDVHALERELDTLGVCPDNPVRERTVAPMRERVSVALAVYAALRGGR